MICIQSTQTQTQRAGHKCSLNTHFSFPSLDTRQTSPVPPSSPGAIRISGSPTALLYAAKVTSTSAEAYGGFLAFEASQPSSPRRNSQLDTPDYQPRPPPNQPNTQHTRRYNQNNSVNQPPSRLSSVLASQPAQAHNTAGEDAYTPVSVRNRKKSLTFAGET